MTSMALQTRASRRGERSELASSASVPKGGGATRHAPPVASPAARCVTAAVRVSAET